MMSEESPASSFSRHRAFISPTLSAPTFPTFSRSPSRSPSPNPIPNTKSSPNSNRASSSTSRLSSSAAAAPYAHNLRLALALVPAALFLLDLGGATVLTVLGFGLLISYALDALGLRTASFISLWLSLSASQLAFYFSAAAPAVSSIPLTVLSLLLAGETTFLIGTWASLQFKWLQLEHVGVPPTLERLLFACTPIVAPAILTWAVVAALGMQRGAYYHMVLSCVYYWLFSIPRKPSFPTSGGDRILGELESCIHTLYLLFAPLLFHIAAHYKTLFSSPANFCDLLLLFFIPFLFQLYASTRGAMWWVTQDMNQIHSIRVANGAVGMVVVVICLEIRVVFNSFAQYLHAPPLLNYFLVTVAMLGGAMSVGAYAVGMVADAVSSVAFTAMCMVCSAAAAVVIGFPVLVSIVYLGVYVL